ncbi:MAG: BrnT family toxin [Methylicorpusculum sp.]|uniref:BrnT family toxin n=1 Tax=Methylicorpusculum sp. TaxID=2713644 RepID=UPI00272526CC|nr:BrnT family toxin [Methylicorpusculum sp.]MDO8846607.1 BrnT family toxin [Methylicorpusculum sp.]MDO8941104.1 BrnT family toxin [Methylicorpusculum sp.]MDP2201129.1 BrnT family toxin [Methylicorpusculum sp.]
MIDLSKIIGFDWDVGNSQKNLKHSVSTAESEQVFFNAPLLLLEDFKHSQLERRFHTLGKIDNERLLPISFALRNNGKTIRVISARVMHKKERSIYEQTT